MSTLRGSVVPCCCCTVLPALRIVPRNSSSSEIGDPLADLRGLPPGQALVELDLFSFVDSDDVSRSLELHRALPQTRFRLGELHSLVFAAQTEIGAAALDLLEGLLALGALLLEPLLQLARVEGENRTSLLHLRSFRRHHRDLEIPDIIQLRGPEAPGLGRRQGSGHVDPRDEVAAFGAHPFALAIRGELIPQRPTARHEKKEKDERDGDARSKQAGVGLHTHDHPR